jgi:hypothetical protein
MDINRLLNQALNTASPGRSQAATNILIEKTFLRQKINYNSLSILLLHVKIPLTQSLRKTIMLYT